MATKLFNYTNQKLNAEKLREVQSFNSSNFGGIISQTSPFSISGDQVVLNTPATFLGGGVLLNQLEDVSTVLSSNNQLWYLEVTLDSSVANITTDELIDSSSNSKILFKSTACDYINNDKTYTYFSPIEEATGNPSINQYYQYNSSNDSYSISTDIEVNPSTDYYYKIEVSKITFRSSSISTSTFTYFGNTLWLNKNTFIIPLYAKINNNLVQTVVVRDLSDLEGLLSLSSYAKLKNYLEENFVWSSGGQEPIGNHKKGDIGYLNITDNIISRNNASNGVVKISRLAIDNLKNGANDIHTKLCINDTGIISVKRDYIQPISHGGTGATERGEAKRKLGIFYGTKSPTSSFPTSSPQIRDIYFKIIE